MAKSEYDYSDGKLAIIKQHSVVKNLILKEYLKQYFYTLSSDPRIPAFKVSIVDGFAGGGLYRHEISNEEIEGSPLVILRAVREADFRINSKRIKPFALNVQYFFVEKDLITYNRLNQSLSDAGFNPSKSPEIHVLHGEFNQHFPRIAQLTHQHTPKNERTIYILDQYGYKDINIEQLRRILVGNNGNEVILTFGIDSYLNFFSGEASLKSLQEIGLLQAMPDYEAQTIKEHANWRRYLQSRIYEDLVAKTGAKFFTPFFMRNKSGHGDYWLIHLSNHVKARDVMTTVHWQFANQSEFRFEHYRGHGFNIMQGYNPVMDGHGVETPLFEFNDGDQFKMREVMIEEVPKIIIDRNEVGISIREFIIRHCNKSPARLIDYQNVFFEIQKYGEFEIKSEKNSSRKMASTIQPSDLIVRKKQRDLFIANGIDHR